MTPNQAKRSRSDTLTPIGRDYIVIKAIRILAGIVFATYVAYIATFTLSIWSLSNQGPMPPDKTVDATPLIVSISGAILLLIPIVAVTLGILAAITANQRRQKAWRNTYIVLSVLAFPGPALGAAFIVGGLFAGGLLYVMIPGLVFAVAPIIMSIVALVHEREAIAPTQTVFAPAI